MTVNDTNMSDELERTCGMCDGLVELVDIEGHWLQLYCENCDRTFERAASSDMSGVSTGDLKNITSFTNGEE